MSPDPDVVASLREVPIDDPMTLQLKLGVEYADAGNPVTDTVSTVWVKAGDAMTLEETLHEDGDDPKLAGAAERASATAVDVESRFRDLAREPDPEFAYEAPDGSAAYRDTTGTEHEL